MKALTILEPWASAIAHGIKRIETRSWETKYRGPIAIHAGMSNQFIKHPTAEAKMAILQLASENYKREQSKGIVVKELHEFVNTGHVIAIADLVDCTKMVDISYMDKKYASIEVKTGATLANGQVVPMSEVDLGNYEIGRYAWILENVRLLIKPVAVKGQQGLWNWNETGIMHELKDCNTNAPTGAE